MMKALILAAGLGTRLQPYTDRIPKPLFPIDGKPLLDILIRQLITAGCTDVAINTHHLHDRIDAYLSEQSYDIRVITRYEPELLGTGGAIGNLSDFWGNHPFLVINSDILTDIDFKSVYEFHRRNNAPATLVLTDTPPLNSVSVNNAGNISSFFSTSESGLPDRKKTYTFTGIQVLDPRILGLIPKNTFYSSIDVYRQLIARGTPPKAYMALSSRWTDIGTPERYSNAVRDAMAPDAFQEAFGCPPSGDITWTQLEGDGSDRFWHRLHADSASLVASW